MSNTTIHLQFLVTAIARLASHSFQIKGWSVVIVSALFALSAGSSQPVFVQLAAVTALVFWGLDGFYLAVETAYRHLYNDVRQLPEKMVGFNMSLPGNAVAYSKWTNARGSKKVLQFHGAVAVAVFLVALALR